MRWRASRLIVVTVVAVALVSVVLIAASWHHARDWRRTNQEVAALMTTIAELEGRLAQQRELQPNRTGAHLKGDSIDGEQRLGELLQRRVGPVEAISPLACKLQLASARQKMNLRLSVADVTVPEGMDYGFAAWMRDGKLPSAGQVPDLLRRLELTEELVYQTARAQLSELKQVEYLGEKRRGGDLLLAFRLRVTGEVSAVRQFLELVDGANYLFLVRSVDWRFADDGRTEAVVEVHYLELEMEPLLMLLPTVAAAKEELFSDQNTSAYQ